MPLFPLRPTLSPPAHGLHVNPPRVYAVKNAQRPVAFGNSQPAVCVQKLDLCRQWPWQSRQDLIDLSNLSNQEFNDTQAKKEDFRTDLTQALVAPKSGIWVAKNAQNHFTGTGMLMPSAAHPSVGYFLNLVVKPEYRGQGIGRILINEVTTQAKKLGYQGVLLTCQEPLVPLYQRRGFQRVPDLTALDPQSTLQVRQGLARVKADLKKEDPQSILLYKTL